MLSRVAFGEIQRGIWVESVLIVLGWGAERPEDELSVARLRKRRKEEVTVCLR
jgi:hypothetical protein